MISLANPCIDLKASENLPPTPGPKGTHRNAHGNTTWAVPLGSVGPKKLAKGEDWGIVLCANDPEDWAPGKDWPGGIRGRSCANWGMIVCAKTLPNKSSDHPPKPRGHKMISLTDPCIDLKASENLPPTQGPKVAHSNTHGNTT